MSDEELTYEMLWDCKFCGQKKLLGLTHRCCANCGAPQDPAARYFPPDEEKVAVQNHEYAGADVTCPACKASTSQRAKCCTQCGSPLDKGIAVQTRQEQVRDEHAQFVAETSKAARREFGGQGAPPPAAPLPVESKASGKSWILALVAAAALLMVGLLIVVVVWKRGASIEVAKVAWERSVDVETMTLDRRSAWCNELPAGSRELSRRKEQHGTDKVEDGKDCKVKRKDKGDGTYKESKECTPRYKDVPKMDDKCDFEAATWKKSRTLKQNGGPADAPSWPKVELTRPGSCMGCEREGARAEAYNVTLVDIKSRSEDTCAFPENKWRAFKVGMKLDAKKRVMTGGLDCDSIVAKP